MQPKRRRARVLLVATFLIFFLPIVGAWVLNVFAPDWRPFGTVNHGSLVQPVRQLSAASLAGLDGMKRAPDALSGRWTIVHVIDGPCRERCVEALARTRQVQQALGGDMNRVRRLIVFASPVHGQGIEASPDLTLAVADNDWLANFSFTDDRADFVPGIYLVDPQGYLMMRYPPDMEQRGLLGDLERLLKISKIG